MFQIAPVFNETSALVTRLALCEVRLALDIRWPWLILIPMREGMVELEDLGPADRHLVMDEILRAGPAARAVGEVLDFPVEKLNVAAIGNRQRQLHIHVAGRHEGDPNWPDPIWGFGTAAPPAPGQRERMIAAAMDAFEATPPGTRR